MSVYVFEAGRIVGTKRNKSKEFSFNLNTFLFFRYNIVEVPIINLNTYISSGSLSNLGRLYSSELKSLLDCINNSAFVQRGIKSKIISYLLASELDY
ncbi:MAG: hypothetical protein GY936_17045 [Ignavibacteriae bacterium]|nr:hypothetical protein [Ignavibacteriota bacterium]